jgi:hypothetical protein
MPWLTGTIASAGRQHGVPARTISRLVPCRHTDVVMALNPTSQVLPSARCHAPVRTSFQRAADPNLVHCLDTIDRYSSQNLQVKALSDDSQAGRAEKRQKREADALTRRVRLGRRKDLANDTIPDCK